MSGLVEGEIKAYWGAAHLTRWADDTLREVRIPLASKEFLAEVGLPSPGRDIHGWVFTWDLSLPYYNDAHHLRILGRAYGTLLVLIDESRDGCITWIESEDGYERYINASAPQFASSLLVLDERYQNVLRSLDEPYDRVAIANRLTVLQKRLNEIDPTALADQNSLWSTIIFDIQLELR